MRAQCNRRGTIIVGYSAIILATGVACSLVLVRSLEGYASSARLEHKLQAQAAAEGAARLIAAAGGSAESPIRIGACAVEVESPADPATRTLRVTVSSKAGREVYSGNWNASFDISENGRWTVGEVAR